MKKKLQEIFLKETLVPKIDLTRRGKIKLFFVVAAHKLAAKVFFYSST